MTREEFETELRREGYEPDFGTLAPSRTNSEHAHDYDVKALVLAGEITLTCAGERRTYREGDVFVMAAGNPHLEEVGGDGVSYVVGRRR